MKLIYENDIPDMPDDIVYAEDNELYLTPQGLRPRWKPNGITDNREEWRKESRKPINILARAFIKSGCNVNNIKNLNP